MPIRSKTKTFPSYLDQKYFLFGKVLLQVSKPLSTAGLIFVDEFRVLFWPRKSRILGRYPTNPNEC